MGEHPPNQAGEMGQRIAESSSSWWQGAVPLPGDTVPGFAEPCCGVGPGTLLLPWLCLTTRSGPGKAGSARGRKSEVISISWTHPGARGADVCAIRAGDGLQPSTAFPGCAAFSTALKCPSAPAALSIRRGKGALAIITDAPGLGSRYSVSTSSTGSPG